MKRLFLCSSFADVANLFVDCAKEDLQGKIIAFIPTASLTEPIRFYVKKGKKALASNPQLSSSASFLRLNVLSSLN